MTMRTTVTYQVQFQRNGVWWNCGGARLTIEAAQESASRYAAMQPKGSNFGTLPQRMIEITETRTVKLVVPPYDASIAAQSELRMIWDGGDLPPQQEQT